MNFDIVFTAESLEDLGKIKKTGNKALLKKLYSLLQELRVHPESGTGKPEKLRYHQQNVWSRRIDSRHRLVYLIDGDKIVVSVLGAYGHYKD
ncbi:toxin YoeB [Dyadobacter jejuensis]|uniref:Putative mRNA interferase YoeB n=1 Tax=Dyadobacter jejuensis TaxID=1082580 RepID=A0A316AH63_9BACT|nr:Txe/YoeB family addiction module toxin [Dyadobacter jejuensis]PWJ56608.1 toxin YoeB [Dyadobacter jejuensis]